MPLKLAIQHIRLIVLIAPKQLLGLKESPSSDSNFWISRYLKTKVYVAANGFVCVWKTYLYKYTYTLRRSFHRRESPSCDAITITQENSNTSFCYSDLSLHITTRGRRKKELELCAVCNNHVLKSLIYYDYTRLCMNLLLFFCFVYFFFLSFPEIFILVWPPDRVLCVCVHTRWRFWLCVCVLPFYLSSSSLIDRGKKGAVENAPRVTLASPSVRKEHALEFFFSFSVFFGCLLTSDFFFSAPLGPFYWSPTGICRFMFIIPPLDGINVRNFFCFSFPSHDSTSLFKTNYDVTR